MFVQRNVGEFHECFLYFVSSMVELEESGGIISSDEKHTCLKILLYLLIKFKQFDCFVENSQSDYMEFLLQLLDSDFITDKENFNHQYSKAIILYVLKRFHESLVLLQTMKRRLARSDTDLCMCEYQMALCNYEMGCWKEASDICSSLSLSTSVDELEGAGILSLLLNLIQLLDIESGVQPTMSGDEHRRNSLTKTSPKLNETSTPFLHNSAICMLQKSNVRGAVNLLEKVVNMYAATSTPQEIHYDEHAVFAQKALFYVSLHTGEIEKANALFSEAEVNERKLPRNSFEWNILQLFQVKDILNESIQREIIWCLDSLYKDLMETNKRKNNPPAHLSFFDDLKEEESFNDLTDKVCLVTLLQVNSLIALDESESARDLLVQRSSIFESNVNAQLWQYNLGVLHYKLQQFNDALKCFKQCNQDESGTPDPETTPIDLECATLLQVNKRTKDETNLRQVNEILMYLRCEYEKEVDLTSDQLSTHLHPYFLACIRVAQVKCEHGDYYQAFSSFSETLLRLDQTQWRNQGSTCWEVWKHLFVKYMRDIASKKCQRMSQKIRTLIWSFLESLSTTHASFHDLLYEISEVKSFLLRSISLV
jgi:tetratricopeptide (TPR) repeat protein